MVSFTFTATNFPLYDSINETIKTELRLCFFPEPPWFPDVQTNFEAEVGSQAMLFCRARGDPPLTLAWTKNSAPLPPHAR